ncbi:MAG: hypothetical protein IID30_15485 [Planctomycetes bacterium]|nr:hypothetical protein [Planctomycetota bacterium]MCH7601134.1 hypothetical protein [Planctomycetota bacterium]
MSYEQWEAIQQDTNLQQVEARSRSSWKFFEWGSTGLAVCMPIMILLLFPTWSIWMNFLVGMTLAFLVIIFFVGWWAHSKRKYLWILLALHGFPICTHCGYDLRGSSNSSHCPECGTKRETVPEPPNDD